MAGKKGKDGGQTRPLKRRGGLQTRGVKKRSTEKPKVSIPKVNVIDDGMYESIINGITSGVWVADSSDMIYYANKAMEMIAGVTQQKLIGSGVFTDLAESSTKYFKLHFKEAKDTLKPVYYSEVPVITQAGRQTYQSGWLIPRVKDGAYDGMICTVEDITNQKEARREQRVTEAKYRSIVDNANSIILRMDVKGNIIFLNKFAEKFFGFDERDILGKNVVGTIMADTERHQRNIQRMLKEIGRYPDRYANREYENVRRDGERVWIAWTNRAIFSDGLNVSEILCIGNDITQQKYNERLLKRCRTNLEQKVKERTSELAAANVQLKEEVEERRWVEDVLRNSEERYRLVVENADEGIVVNQDGFFKYVNPKAVKILGRPEEELVSRPIVEFIHPEDREMIENRRLKMLKGESIPSVFSCRIVDRDLNVKWVEVNSVLISWMGRPAALAFFSNISERKRAEEQLHLMEAAVQQAKDSIVITTANPGQPSRIVFVNQAFTNLSGYTADEVIGKPSVILRGPEGANIEWHALESEISKGRRAFYVETATSKKDGSTYDLEWQITPLRDQRGKVTHFVSIQREITERKKAERRFRADQIKLRSLASELLLAEERERRRIATDLHDHIGQTLAITKIKLGTLKGVPGSQECQEGIDEIRSLVEKTIQYTKSLTFELSPPILYEIGFEATIEWLSEQMQKQHYILFDFETDGEPKPIAKDVSILLFQIVRELFMNIVKHSQAHQVTTQIARHGETMRILVEDDGIGFDPSHIEKNQSFGFFSIDERLKHFGGSLEIDTSPGHGTRIAVISPLAVRTERKVQA